MKAGTNLADAFSSISSYFNTSNISVAGTVNGVIAPPAPVSDAERELQMEMAFPGALDPPHGADDLPALETAVGLMSSQAAFDTFVGNLIGTSSNGQNWLVTAVDFLRNQAHANGQNDADFVSRFSSDIMALAIDIPDVPPEFLASTREELSTFLLDTAKGIG